MLRQKLALYSPEGEGGSGGGAAGGDHQNGGQGKGGDDVVPKTQFLAAINSANQKYAALEARLNAILEQQKQAPAEQPKRYTRGELNAAVEARQITQEQADAQWDAQVREETLAQAQTVAAQTVTAAQRQEKVLSAIERYKAAVPDIMVEGSDTRERIRKEFNALIELGDPDNVVTQLKAIRAALGPVENVEKAHSGRSSVESHRESGGDGGNGKGGDGGSRKSSDGVMRWADLSERQQDHYQKLIDKGMYKDRKAVEEELKFASSRVMQRYGATG